MSQAAAIQAKPVFALKGGSFTLTTIYLFKGNTTELSSQLAKKIKLAPRFFANAPVVLDAAHLQEGEKLRMADLKACMLKHNLIPVGLKGASKEAQEDALKIGIPIFPDPRNSISNKEIETKLVEKRNLATDEEPIATKTAPTQSTPTKMVTHPVRSGQQIYAPGGDLLVLAPVSPGAELLADGHIHVHGPLRGRALAGINGDTSARIFCHSLEAELVSICGQFQISEDLKEAFWKRPAQICLRDEKLHISDL